MSRIHNLRLVRPTRKQLRRESTPQEVILWSRLRRKQLGFKFKRQHSIGRYIADFYCCEGKLIIEVDGSQHMERKEYDADRTLYFESLGLRVIRFWNNEVNNDLPAVIAEIEVHLLSIATSPNPSSSDEGRECPITSDGD